MLVTILFAFICLNTSQEAIVEADHSRQEAPSSVESIEALVNSVRAKFDDPAIPPEARARMTLEAAGEIRRAGQLETSVEARADRLRRAVSLLDDFIQANPGNPMGLDVALRAGFDRWTEGSVWLGRLAIEPANAAVRQVTTEVLNDAIVRLRRIWTAIRAEGREDPFVDSVRYFYALALADRATLEEDPVAKLERQDGALALLAAPIANPELAGRATLLKAKILIVRKQWRQVEETLEELEDLPGPSAIERLDVRLDRALERREFDDAIAAIEAAELNPSETDLRMVRVRARQWISLFENQRAEIEADAFARVRRLRDSGAPEAARALVILSTAIVEPDNKADPEAWELLADGHRARGDYLEAINLNRLGADFAEGEGNPELAWRMRYRAAALLYRTGRLESSAELLGPLADAARDPQQPAVDDQRANASLLHGLVQGRLASAPGASRSSRSAYETALQEHIDAFPDDPTSDEARWTLGELYRVTSRFSQAQSVWSDLDPNDPRWILTRETIITSLRLDINQLLANDRLQDAQAALDETKELATNELAAAINTDQVHTLELLIAELELTPGLETPESALERLNRLTTSENRSEPRGVARRLRIVALALDGRFQEAESVISSGLGRSDAAEQIELADRLDQSVEAMPNQPDRARLARLVTMVASRVLRQAETLAAPEVEQARALQLRGQLYSGDQQGARANLQRPTDLGAWPISLVERWTVALDALGEYQLAIPAYQLLNQSRQPGSHGWFEARYGLAVAYYRSNLPDQAIRLIDGTAALHPGLGGSELKEKFLRLRRRLGPR